MIFDKSPQYLGNRKALELIREYQQLGNDVRLFAMIRDPRDAIASQYTLWRHHVEGDSPSRREQLWLEKYAHLETLQTMFENLSVFATKMSFRLRVAICRCCFNFWISNANRKAGHTCAPQTSGDISDLVWVH